MAKKIITRVLIVVAIWGVYYALIALAQPQMTIDAAMAQFQDMDWNFAGTNIVSKGWDWSWIIPTGFTLIILWPLAKLGIQKVKEYTKE